jgi:hypothetical protein
MTTVVVAPTAVAMFPEGGGHFWVYLQWIRGLQRAGCDVWWLENLAPLYGREPNPAVVDTFLRNLDAFGLADRAVLYRDRDGGGFEFVNADERSAWRILDGADLLLNFRYGTSAELVGRVARSALVDVDPGLLQFWLSHGQLDLPRHDRYFTTGERIGTARVPDCGLAWELIHPVVDTESWPYDDRPRRDVFTTVTNWFGEWLTDGGDWLLDNSKRVEFLKLVDLPRRTAQQLELAVCLGANAEDAVDRTLLERNGWRVRHSFEVSGDPFTYRDYIRSSRGEFSCVKPSCLLFQNAWVSDRTLCYLASGRPVVVQDTGPSAVLPSGEGMFRFSTADGAAAALDAVNTKYDYHCRAARELAETHFDARATAERVLTSTLP